MKNQKQLEWSVAIGGYTRMVIWQNGIPKEVAKFRYYDGVYRLQIILENIAQNYQVEFQNFSEAAAYAERMIFDVLSE